MNISVALDGPKRRNLKLYPGDEVTLSVTVYTHDADLTPVAVTNLAATLWPYNDTLTVGSEFVVSSNYWPRQNYRIQGDVAGVRTTLCYGVVQTIGLPECDYGWWWDGRIFDGGGSSGDVLVPVP